jgi:outer membrane biosynthesis protein TonB
MKTITFILSVLITLTGTATLVESKSHALLQEYTRQYLVRNARTKARTKARTLRAQKSTKKPKRTKKPKTTDSTKKPKKVKNAISTKNPKPDPTKNPLVKKTKAPRGSTKAPTKPTIASDEGLAGPSSKTSDVRCSVWVETIVIGTILWFIF